MFRYLTDFGAGQIKSEYLADDQLHTELGDRWAFQYEHNGIFQQAWKFEIDYSKVSDINYFSDLDSGVGNREDGQLIQEGRATYRSDNWDSALLVRDFQLLTKDTTSTNLPYRLMPQLSYNYYAPETMKYLDLDLVSHVSRFETDARGKPLQLEYILNLGSKFRSATLGATGQPKHVSWAPTINKILIRPQMPNWKRV